jgi:hypothetical protein
VALHNIREKVGVVTVPRDGGGERVVVIAMALATVARGVDTVTGSFRSWRIKGLAGTLAPGPQEGAMEPPRRVPSLLAKAHV